MKQKIKISGRPSLLWLVALSLIIIVGVILVKDYRAYMSEAVNVFADGGSYTPPNNSFTDLMG